MVTCFINDYARNVRFLYRSTIRVWTGPSEFFELVRTTNHLGIALGLQVLRWLLHSGVTTAHFVVVNPPAMFPVPFDLDLGLYRSWEVWGFFPFGLGMLGLIAWVTWRVGRRRAGRPMSLAKTAEVVSLAWFAPWLPTFLTDNLLLSAGWAIPVVIVPAHTVVVGLEVWMTAVGLQQVFGLSRGPAWRISLAGGLIFMALAGAVIR